MDTILAPPRIPRQAWLLIATLLALLPPRAAGACSVTRDFLPPSNYELVRLAEHVVMARATGEAPELRCALI